MESKGCQAQTCFIINQLVRVYPMLAMLSLLALCALLAMRALHALLALLSIGSHAKPVFSLCFHRFPRDTCVFRTFSIGFHAKPTFS